MSNKNYISGTEEAFARLFSFALTVLFFIIYILARGNSLQLDWVGLLSVLSIFWLVYELLGLVLDIVFNYFAKEQREIKQEETITPTIDA